MGARDVLRLERYWAGEQDANEKAQLQRAMIAATMFNLHRGGNRERKTADFMLRTKAEVGEEQAASVLEFFRSNARPAAGKKRNRKKRR